MRLQDIGDTGHFFLFCDSYWPFPETRGMPLGNLDARGPLVRDPEPFACLDESRLRLSSRYCSFATTLLCKPIKHGLTIYCLNFCRTRYLYNFEWFTGKQSEHGLGQPIDTTPLDEDNPEEMNYMLGLMDRLINKDFDYLEEVARLKDLKNQ